MKSITLTRRAVAAGAASALAAGALVGLTAPAQAAPVTTSYSCEYATLGLGPWTVAVDSEVPAMGLLPAGLPAGFAIEGGFGVTNHFTLPAEAHEAMVTYGVEDISFPDYAGSFGTTSVGVSGMTGKVSQMTENPDGSWSFDSPGTTTAFKAPRAGSYDITAPDVFDMTALVGGNEVAVPCTLTSGAQPGIYKAGVTVVKNDSKANAKAVNSPTRKGKVAKVRVKVTADNHTPGGKVVLKRGKKTVAKGNLNRKGVVVLKTKALRVGKNRLVAQYKGDGYTKKSTDKLVFKVRR